MPTTDRASSRTCHRERPHQKTPARRPKSGSRTRGRSSRTPATRKPASPATSMPRPCRPRADSIRSDAARHPRRILLELDGRSASSRTAPATVARRRSNSGRTPDRHATPSPRASFLQHRSAPACPSSSAWVLREVPLAELRCTVETLMDVAVGRATTCSPKWFEKTTPPRTGLRRPRDHVAAADRHGADRLRGPPRSSTSPRSAHRAGRPRDHRDPDVLVRGFGVAMVERAMIDVVDSRAHRSTARSRPPSRISSASPRVALSRRWATGRRRACRPPDSSRSVHRRHARPLTVAGFRRSNGCSTTSAAEEDVAAYGLTRFKVKIGGDLDKTAPAGGVQGRHASLGDEARSPRRQRTTDRRAGASSRISRTIRPPR